jgi:phosphatidyl-myo-inositol dimannoside synthase
VPRSGCGLRILMLVTEAHGGFGGIAQYNRDVIDVLSRQDCVEEIVVLPLVVSSYSFVAPSKVKYVQYDIKGSGGRLRFLAVAAAQVISLQRFDAIYCAHINLMPIAAFIRGVRRVPVVLAIYGIDAWQRSSVWFSGLAVSCSDLVISISQLTLDRFREWSAIDGIKTAIVPNAIRSEKYGVGAKRADLAARLGLTGGPVIMTFGRLSSAERYKGFDETLELLPQLRQAEPDLKYLIAGDGDDRPRLEAKAFDLGLANSVVFSGPVPEESKADYYRLADAYVMPSSGEGFGFVVIEAMACGIPVVVSATDGTREAVRGGELGFVVDPKDREALRKAVLEALCKPKCVPPGLAYFSFEKFTERLVVALTRIIKLPADDIAQ